MNIRNRNRNLALVWAMVAIVEAGLAVYGYAMDGAQGAIIPFVVFVISMAVLIVFLAKSAIIKRRNRKSYKATMDYIRQMGRPEEEEEEEEET